MESLSPNIFVNDIQATIDFYTILGFSLVANVPDDAPFVWVMMANGSVTIMFQTFESLGEELPEISRSNGGSLLYYIKIKSIRTFYSSIENRVKVIKGLDKTFYGATEFSIVDNNGYVLTFAEDE